MVHCTGWHVKLNPQLSQALTNLRGNRDFVVVLEGLKEHIREETDRCVEAEGNVQQKAAGAVKALRTWFEMFNDAPKVLEKYKQSGTNTQ